MAGEQNLRDRWGDVFHDTAEYQAALRADAAAKVQRNAQAQAAMRAANARGDARRAAAIQAANLQADQDAQLGRGGGRVAALDAFQEQRVGDYLDQERERGPARVAEALRPTRAAANGPGYVQSLLEPDYSDDFPYMTVKPGKFSDFTGANWDGVERPASMRAPRGNRPQTLGGGDTLGSGQLAETNAYGVSREQIEANRPTRAMLDNSAQDAENTTTGRIRRDQALRNTLPADLAETYSGMLRDRVMTPREFEDFIAAPPETQYAKLRTRQAQTRNFRPGPVQEGGGTITSASGIQDYMGDNSPGIRTDNLRDVQTFPMGTQGLIDLPTLSRPGGTRRPTTQLAAPTPLSFNYAPFPKG